MTITAFATVLGEKRQRIQDVELGRQKAPQEVLTRIVEKLHINANWLLTGQGEMYKGSEKQDMKIVKMAELMEGLDAAQRQEILSAIAEKQQLNEMKHQLKQLTTDWQKRKSA